MGWPQMTQGVSLRRPSALTRRSASDARRPPQLLIGPIVRAAAESARSPLTYYAPDAERTRGPTP